MYETNFNIFHSQNEVYFKRVSNKSDFAEFMRPILVDNTGEDSDKLIVPMNFKQFSKIKNLITANMDRS